MKLSLILVSFILTVVASCAANWDNPNPTATASTKEYPCGVLGLVCAVMPQWQDDTCCQQGDSCPGPHAGDCAPGFCCDAEPFDPSPQYGKRATDAGAPRAMRPIRKAIP
jgi:hypothetical protein